MEVRLHRAGNAPLLLLPEDKAKIREMVGWPPKVDGFAFKSQEQVDCIVELRAALKDLEGKCHFMSQDIDDARHLLCFARARKFKVKKAEEMWRSAYEWRAARDPRSVCETYKVVELVDKYSTGGPWNDDPEGSPCFIDPLGRIYLNELLGKDPNLHKLMVDFEIVKNEMIIAQMDRNTLRDGRIHTQATVILDVTDAGFRHVHGPALSFLKEAIELGDNYYPERVKTMFVVNAPTIIWAIYKILGVFIDEGTKEKIVIDNGIKSLVDRGFKLENMPTWLGGTKEDSLGQIRMGGKPL